MNQAEARTGICRDGHGRNRVLFAICLIIGALCAVAVTAQDTPFTSQNPFETSGERPTKLFGAGGAPVPFPPADGDTVLWSAVAEKRATPVDSLDAGDFTFEVDGKKREIA